MSTGFGVDPRELRDRAPELAHAAEAIAEVERVVTAALTAPAVITSALRSPDTALQAERALLRAVTNSAGLGFALAPGAALAERLAADAIGLRICAVTYENPELAASGDLDRLVDLLDDGRQVAAVALVATSGGAALGDLAPVLPELLALNALLDENPFDDPAGWEILRGDAPSVDPVLGVSLDWLAGLMADGPGSAVRVADLPAHQQETGIDGYLDTLDRLEHDGRVVVQTVRGPDGAERYVVALPGVAGGSPVLPSPQDLSGALRDTQYPDSAYTRAVQQAMHQAGVPVGAEVLLVGHSAGAVAAMNLAQDPAFNGARYTVTDVVAVGAPVDHKTVPPGTEVVTVTNDRDLVPTLDGRGPGAPDPAPPGRTEIRVEPPAHQPFPSSHGVDTYRQLLDRRAVDARIPEYATAAVIDVASYRLADQPATR